MSWLARSIANTFNLDGDDKDAVVPNSNTAGTSSAPPDADGDPSSSPTSPSQGVREDISELTKTLTKQLWGVASFLAPPPQSDPYKPLASDPNANRGSESVDQFKTNPEGIAGLRSDIAEIGGKVRTGLVKLSENIPVSDITKMASSFLQLGSDEEEAGAAVGVTDDIVAFARDIAMHPETWLEFPLPESDEDDEEFDMSDAQQEHALAVERLSPRLAALRIELCPGYMSESCFWKIYFVLVHPRLDEHDAEILSTPEILRARALLTQGIKNRNNASLDGGSDKNSFESNDTSSNQREEFFSVPSNAVTESEPSKTSDPEPATTLSVLESTTSDAGADIDTEKQSIAVTDIPIVDKSMIEEGGPSKIKDKHVHGSSHVILEGKDEDDGDDWLKEESSEIDGSGKIDIPIENDEDVSFSDLEEDDDVPTSTKKVTYSSDKDSKDWVQL